MIYHLSDLRSASLDGKRVFLRADTDVPLCDLKSQNSNLKTEIEDDTRLKAWLPTLQYLLDQGAKVIIGGKLGRPKGVDESLSLKPVAEWLKDQLKVQSFDKTQDKSSKFKVEEKRIGEFEGWEITPKLYLLENLQFNPQEKANDLEFTKKLASLADIYVNDAFAMCHRNHASVVGIPTLLPSFAGFRLQEEVNVLSTIMDQPKRPFIVVIGGAKIETKVPLVTKMCAFADYVLVGGKIAMEREALVKAQQECKEKKSEVIIADLNFDGTDISKRSLLTFIEIIKKAKTVVWNGPVGKVQGSKFNLSTIAQDCPEQSRMDKVQSLEGDTEKGTRELAKAIAQSSAYTVVGGGDTLEFLTRNGFFNKFSFTSTGGGAMLSFLSGEELPGIEALIK